MMLSQQGGRRTRTFFAGLLGLDGQDLYDVESVALQEGRFAVRLAALDRPAVVVFVDTNEGDRPAFLHSDALRVSVQGKAIPPEIERALRAKALSNPRGATFETLEHILKNDPESRAGAPADLARPKEPPSFPDRAPDAYADFFARVDILCQKIVTMWLFNPCTLILHGDRECFGPPNLGISMVMTINAPWDNHVRDIGRPRSATPRLSEPDPDGLLGHFTDLRERDVIAGAREKELAIFEHVFAKDPGLVVFFHACVGVVSSTDVMSIYKQHKEKHHLPVLYFRGGENQDMLNFYREILVDRRLAAARYTDPPKANLVNLVGFTGQMTTDVLDALAQIGVDVNGVILPAVDLGAAERFESAALTVIMPNVDFQNFHDQLLEGSKVPRSMYLPAPHGLVGTKRWLSTVAKAAGCEANVESVWTQLLAGREERWEKLSREASKHSLGFVVRSRDVAQLLDPASTYGIPLLATVAEAGFGIEVLIEGPDEASRAEAQKRLEEALAGSAKVRFRGFSTFEEMATMLRESRCDAFFSNFFFDWRITSAGKSIFSLQHFESGIDGAFRTVERLLKLCRTGLFRDYSRYLRRDPGGRRLGRPAA